MILNPERTQMDVVDNSLIIVGDDSIKNLFEFVKDREQIARESNDFPTWLTYARILTELSLAITSYAGRKKKCPE